MPYKTKEDQAAYRQRNRKRINENNIRSSANNVERIQKYNREYQEKLRLEKISLASSSYKYQDCCSICGNEETVITKNGYRKSLALDHNHTTGQIRGLLCYRCNSMLGYGKDDPDILEKGAEYLRKWKNLNPLISGEKN